MRPHVPWYLHAMAFFGGALVGFLVFPYLPIILTWSRVPPRWLGQDSTAGGGRVFLLRLGNPFPRCAVLTELEVIDPRVVASIKFARSGLVGFLVFLAFLSP